MTRSLKTLTLFILVFAFFITGCGSSNNSSQTDSGTTPGDTHEQNLPKEWTAINWQDHYPDFKYNGLQPGCLCTDCENTDGAPVDSEFRFFIKGGTVNNLVVFFEGGDGGACWNRDTCFGKGLLEGNPTCTQEITITADLLTSYQEMATDGEENEIAKGIFLRDTDNPFNDWNFIYIPYCTGDTHLGANAIDYANSLDKLFGNSLVVQHRGAVNFNVVMKWIMDNVDDPDKIFITGSSVGSYGAIAYYPNIKETYPASNVYVLADAGVGIVSNGFKETVNANWNIQFSDDIIDFDGKTFFDLTTDEIISKGALHYPRVRFAEYTTETDNVQVAFYALGLNLFDLFIKGVTNVLASDWNEKMLESVGKISEEAENFKYYIGEGSDHTIMTSTKFYTENSAQGKFFLNWVKNMLDPNFNWNGSDNYIHMSTDE